VSDWCGAAKNVENFVFIALGTGVGEGIFVRGQLLTVRNGAPVRSVTWRSRRKERRDEGEADRSARSASSAVLASRSYWRKLLKRSGRPLDNEFAKLRASQIFDLAREGDALAGEAITYTAVLLADAIADIALLLNPEIVVLGGGVGSHAELLSAHGRNYSATRICAASLRSSALGTQAQLIGAVSMSVNAAEAYLVL